MADPKWDDTTPTWDETQDAKPQADAPKWEDTLGPDEDMGAWQAAGRGTLQGVTMGTRDELAGAIEAPVGALKTAASFLPGVEFNDEDTAAYKKERDLSRALDKYAQEKHGTAYGAGNLAGGLATGLATGGLANAAKVGLLPLAATEAAIVSGGASEAQSGKDLAQDVALGTGLGVGTLGLANKVGAGNLLAGGAGAYAGAQTINPEDSMLEKAGKVAGGALVGVGTKKAIGAATREVGNTLNQLPQVQAFKDRNLLGRMGLSNKAENKLAQEAKVTGATDELASELNAGRKEAEAVLAGERNIAQEQVRKTVEQTNKEIKDAALEIKNLQNQQVKFLEAKNAEEKRRLAQEIYKDSSRQFDGIEKIRRNISTNIDDVIARNEDKVTPTWDTIRNLDTELSVLQQGQGANVAPQIDAIRAKASEFAGDLNINKVLGLRRFLQDEAFSNSDPAIRNAMGKIYDQFKTELGQQVPELNPLFAQYKNIFDLRKVVGRNFTADSLAKAAQGGAKTAEGAVGQAAKQAEINRALGALDPSLQEGQQALIEKAAQYQSVAGKTKGELAEEARNALMEKYSPLAQKAQMPKAQVTDEAVEGLVSPEAKRGAAVYSDLETITGPMKALQSTEGQKMGGGFYDALNNQSRIAAEGGDAAKKSIQIEDFNTIVKTALGEEKGNKLLQNNIEARDILSLFGGKLETPGATTNVLAQALKQSENISGWVGNKLGLLQSKTGGKLSEADVIKRLNAANPQAFRDAAVQMQRIGNDSLAQKMLAVANAGPNNPTQRAAMTYVLKQDPGFRTMLKINESSSEGDQNEQ